MTTEAPSSEAARLEALRRYRILDTASEQTFDEITFLAAHVCVTPIALIAFVDADRVWYKSKVGVTLTAVPREHSFAAHAIREPDLLTVEDATADERFAATPLVASYPYYRAWASVSLVTPDGHALGVLAVVGRTPRKLRPEQEEALRALARQVMTQLELRRSLLELERTVAERTETERVLRESERKFRTLVESAPDGILIVERDGRVQLANHGAPGRRGGGQAGCLRLPTAIQRVIASPSSRDRQGAVERAPSTSGVQSAYDEAGPIAMAPGASPAQRGAPSGVAEAAFRSRTGVGAQVAGGRRDLRRAWRWTKTATSALLTLPAATPRTRSVRSLGSGSNWKPLRPRNARAAIRPTRLLPSTNGWLRTRPWR